MISTINELSRAAVTGCFCALILKERTSSYSKIWGEMLIYRKVSSINNGGQPQGNEMKKRESMRFKILFLCLSSVLTALFVQTILFQNTSAKTIYEQTKEANLHSLHNMQEDITGVLKYAESNLLEVYNQNKLITDLQDHAPISDMREKNYRAAYTMAQAFSAEDKVVALYVYDDFNRIVSAYRHASTPIYSYPEDIFSDTGTYNIKPLRRFMDDEDNVMFISSYYNQARDENMIRFAMNIFDKGFPRQQIGCVVCDVDSDVFFDIIEKYAYGENNIIWLQPVGDRAIISTSSGADEYQSEYERLSADIKAGKSDKELDFDISGEVLFNISSSQYNLEIFSLMPPSLLIENQNILTKNLIIIAVILLIVFGILAIILARGITEPLEYLTNTMRSIRKGNTGLRVDRLGNDEIGELGENFNKMLDEMEQFIAREYKNQLLLQKAEYKALQAQINPHFLHNTLDTMSSIAQIQECNLVSSLSESLSAIFRYSLDIKNPMSTIEKELLHLKNYIFVMDVRMNHEIHYQFEVAESVLSFEIPRLTLQPILENALKYGVRDVKGEKIVKITGQEEEGIIFISVEDNGIGMDTGEINEQLRRNDRDYVEKGDSIGLHNINARIKLLFGEEYGVYVDGAVGAGVKVTVRIPHIKVGE